MPVIKKKSAIFAIYADSPPKAGSSSTSQSATTVPSANQSSSTALRSPTKRSSSAAPRRALSSLQPTPRGLPSSSGGKDPLRSSSSTSKKVLIEKMRPPAQSTTRNSSSRLTTTKPTSTRQFDIFSDATLPPNPKPLRAASAGMDTSKTRSLRGPPLAPRAVSAARPTSVSVSGDKENVTPLDSPAGRTRSKSRSALGVVGRGAVPLAPISGKTATDKPLKSSKTRSKSSIRVLVDPALQDVSEAYSAFGEEPHGFQDQGVQDLSP